MDILSFLPIIILLYAISAIFNPSGNKNRRNPNQNPNNNPRQNPPYNPRPSSAPSPDRWREKFEELERQWFPKQETGRTQTGTAQKVPPLYGSYESYEPEGTSGSEGYGGGEGYLSTEGSSGGEGTSGTEGISGTEGSWGTEGTAGVEGNYTQRSPQVKTMAPKVPGNAAKVKTQTKVAVSSSPAVSPGTLMQGVIWSEVLGKPRSRSGWAPTQKR